MKDIAVNSKGLLIKGRAGTGKSYVAMQIAKCLKGVSKLAFTNKAALNIKGKTIHKFLKIDKEGNISKSLLQMVKDKVKYIIVDEISMINKYLWRRLVELKRFTNATFILIGDHRQCAPVEDETIDNYFNHPAVKYLTNNNMVELTVRHRYNEQLWNILEDVEGVNTKTFNNKQCDRNICYFNKTRKRVNEILMKRNKTTDSTFLQADKEDDTTQDVYIYSGLPIISRKTIKDGDAAVNNEYFKVVSVDEKIKCTSERSDDDGNKVDHVFEFDISEFHKYFHVNYCSTVHKAQGETITEEFTIWDWKYMDIRLKYTAMSRAKTPEQINFRVPSYKKEEQWNLKNDIMISKKLEGHKKYDAEKGLNFDLEVDDVKQLYEKQGGLCYHCHSDVKLNFHGGDQKQLSIDRLNDSMGHKKGNVVIACWECNRTHKNKIVGL
jgi:ATP-dependent exoDNAse (exonuclease V) alpha subunit